MDIEYYVKKLKEHEARRASTNERNAFWKQYTERQNYAPKSVARFEHG